MERRCIVIGASAGGFELVVDIASQLPADLPAPVFVTMHVPAYHRSYLPSILSSAGKLHAIHPEDGRKIGPGFIYVAPPDHHLLVDDGHIAVKRGPKENGFRPSIDALFRSAAYSYGTGTIGVVLSGALHDGTSGLWTIKRLGGTAIVQDPHEAEYASMPRSALEYVNADYTVKASEIAGLLVRLANEPWKGKTMAGNQAEKELEDRIAKEVQVAAGTNVSQKTILELGELTPFACPDCHGPPANLSRSAYSDSVSRTIILRVNRSGRGIVGAYVTCHSSIRYPGESKFWEQPPCDSPRVPSKPTLDRGFIPWRLRAGLGRPQ